MAFDPANFAAVLARHGLAAPAIISPAPEAASAPDAINQDPAQEGADAKETLMSTDEISAKAAPDASAKLAAVTASEHYKGNEAQAIKMLANPALSAEEIIGFLAAAPKVAAADPNAETQAQADAKLAAELLAGHRAGNAPALGGGGNEGNPDRPDTTLVDTVSARYAGKKFR